MKNFQQHKQDLFEGHSDPLQQIRLPGVSSTDEELGRPAPQEQGGEEGEGQSQGGGTHLARTPRSHCSAGFVQRRHTDTGESGRHYSKATLPCNH